MFCKYCGKEVPENAYVCLGCGCVVDNKVVGQKGNNNPLEAEQKPKTRLFKLFLIISLSMSLVAVGMCLLSFAYPCLAYSLNYYNAYLYDVSPNFIFSLLSLIFGAVGMGLGIVTFVFGLKEKESFKMIAICNFIFSLILFLITFFCHVGNF